MSEGMAISRWFVRLEPSASSASDSPPAVALSLLCSGSLMSPKYGDGAPPAQGKQSRRRRERPRREPAADELPLVDEVQHTIAVRQLRREGVEGTGELEDGERGLVELRIAARAADGGAIEPAIRIDGHFDDRARPAAVALRRGREVQGTDPLHFGAPGD